MAEHNPPLYLDQDDAYSAADLGLPFRDIMGEGVVGLAAGELLVTQDTGSDLKSKVAAGAAWIKGDDDANGQPTYRVYNDAPVLLNHAAADATNPRVDRVVAQVLDAGFSGVSKLWRLAIVPGVATAGATLTNLTGVGALPNDAITLGYVLIPAGSGAVTNANISDQRTAAKVGGGKAAPSGGVTVANKISALPAGTDGAQAWLRLLPATYNAGGATALPAGTITVGDTNEFPTAGTLETPNGDIAYTGKTATTFTGCTGGAGTLAASAAIALKTGTPSNSSYDLIGLTYDAALGKWVSPVEWMTFEGALQSSTATAWAELLANGLAGAVKGGWRAYDHAGLKPQLRLHAEVMNNTAGDTVQLAPSFDGADGSAWAVNGARNHNGADTGAASRVTPGATANNNIPLATLWGNLPAVYTLYDHFMPGIQSKVNGGTFNLELAAWELRWVG